MSRIPVAPHDLVESEQLTCRSLVRCPGDEWTAFVEGSPVEVSAGKLSSWMAIAVTPLINVPGLRIFRELPPNSTGVRMIDAFINESDAMYMICLLRVTDTDGHEEYRWLSYARGRKYFRFADLRDAMHLAMRVVSADGETGAVRVLQRAARGMR